MTRKTYKYDKRDRYTQQKRHTYRKPRRKLNIRQEKRRAYMTKESDIHNKSFLKYTANMMYVHTQRRLIIFCQKRITKKN